MIGLSTFVDLFRGMGISYQTDPSYRQRYRHLYEARIKTTFDGGAEFHRGCLFRRGRLNVLHLRGDRFEMAFQHGRLLQTEIAAGSLEMASRITPDAIRQSVGRGALAKMISWYAQNAIAMPLLRHGIANAVERGTDEGEDALAEAYGLSEGSGVSVETIINAALGPETAQTLLGKTGTLAVGSAPSQCTSFTAWNSATAGGEMIIGRNTYYPLTGYFDAHPTVIYFHPTDGVQPYMAVTSAGFHNAGVVGMNAAGLYLATHTVPAARVSETGFPLFMVGQAVLRAARTFDEAEALLRDSKPAAGWQYHLVSTKERKVATMELSCDRIERYDSTGDYHVTTNHWRCPQMAENNLFLNTSTEEDTRARLRRAAQLIEESGGELDSSGAARILGDKTDFNTGTRRIVPNVIGSVHTVSSSVRLPDSGRVYVATGTTPVSRSEFISLPLLDTFDPDSFPSEPVQAIANDRMPEIHPGAKEAERLYIKAKDAIEYDDDAVSALEHLDAALQLAPTDGAIAVMCGLIAIRASRNERAKQALQIAIDVGDVQRQRFATYLLARIYGHEGDKVTALALLADIDGEDRLAQAAERSSGRIEKRGRLTLATHDISPMLFNADAFRYEAIPPWR